MMKKTCENCIHNVLKIDIFRPKENGRRCDNPLSERYEGVVEPNDSCEKWTQKK